MSSNVWSFDDLHDPERIVTVRSRRQLANLKMATLYDGNQHHYIAQQCHSSRAHEWEQSSLTLSGVTKWSHHDVCYWCAHTLSNFSKHQALLLDLGLILKRRNSRPLRTAVAARWLNTVNADINPHRLWWAQLGPSNPKAKMSRMLRHVPKSGDKVLTITTNAEQYTVSRTLLLGAADVVGYAATADPSYVATAAIVDKTILRHIVERHTNRGKWLSDCDDIMEVGALMWAATIPIGAIEDDIAEHVVVAAAQLAAERFDSRQTDQRTVEEQRTLALMAYIGATEP